MRVPRTTIEARQAEKVTATKSAIAAMAREETSYLIGTAITKVLASVYSPELMEQTFHTKTFEGGCLLKHVFLTEYLQVGQKQQMLHAAIKSKIEGTHPDKAATFTISAAQALLSFHREHSMHGEHQQQFNQTPMPSRTALLRRFDDALTEVAIDYRTSHRAPTTTRSI